MYSLLLYVNIQTRTQLTRQFHQNVSRGYMLPVTIILIFKYNKINQLHSRFRHKLNRL